MAEEIVTGILVKTSKETPLQGKIINTIDTPYPEENAYSVDMINKMLVPPLNKLINGDFLSNQRGLSSYTLSANNSMYTLDMWFIYAAQDSTIKVTKKSNSILIETTGLETQFQQIFDILTGKYTISTKIISINGNVKLSKYNNEFTDVKTDLKVGVNNILFDSTFNRIAFRFSGACSLELEYVDLFEGDIAYPHVKEDYAIALLKCRRYILSDYVNAPILYGYNTNRYMFEICFPKMDKVPTLVTCNWSYWSSVGNPVAGTLNELEEIVAFIDNINAVTPSRADKQEKCYSIRIYYLISCEPL